MLSIVRVLTLLTLMCLSAYLSGCATSDSDLNYQRDKSADAPGDHSYHGWNDSNY